MLKKLFLTFFLLFCSFITIYPSKKENTNLVDYCNSFEKILFRNSLVKIKNFSKRYKTYANDFALFGTKKTKGALVNKIIDQYKLSNESYFINYVPNQFYCFAGYWIEEIKPGTFQSILYTKSRERINQYKDIKKEIDKIMNDINLENKFIKKEINNFF